MSFEKTALIEKSTFKPPLNVYEFGLRIPLPPLPLSLSQGLRTPRRFKKSLIVVVNHVVSFHKQSLLTLCPGLSRGCPWARPGSAWTCSSSSGGSGSCPRPRRSSTTIDTFLNFVSILFLCKGQIFSKSVGRARSRCMLKSEAASPLFGFTSH